MNKRQKKKALKKFNKELSKLYSGTIKKLLNEPSVLDLLKI